MNKNIKKTVLLLLSCLLMIFSLLGCSIIDEMTTTNDFTESSQKIEVQSIDEDSVKEPEIIEDIQDSDVEEEIIDENDEQSASNEVASYTFRNDKLLNQHFEKHGGEFDYTNTDEYVQGANRVINDERTLHKIEAEDGDDVYYLEETNEFVVVSTDGYLRTYFKPSAGRKYFDRQ